MKKIIFAVILAVALSVIPVSASTLPETTCQSYNPNTNILIVHVDNDCSSEVFYEGLPSGYHNEAVAPIQEKWSNGFIPAYTYPKLATTTPEA